MPSVFDSELPPVAGHYGTVPESLTTMKAANDK